MTVVSLEPPPSATSPDGSAAPSAGGAPWRPLDIAADDPRLAPLATELAERFSRHCVGMAPDAFERLVRHAAYIRLRWPA